MNDVTLHTSDDAATLASAFVARVVVPGDPFSRPLVLTPGAGQGRWLSQQVALLSGPEGISAGLDSHRFGALESLLAGVPDADDPWAAERLVWAILDVADASDDPALAPLRSHLDANDQRYANALRIARILARYADHRPALLRAWQTEPAESIAKLGFDGWQVLLWHRLHAVITAPDPLARRAALARRIADGELAVPWPAVHVFAPRHVTGVQWGLLRALAASVPVEVWLPTSGPADTAHPVGRALGRRARGWLAGWERIADRHEGHDAPGPASPPLSALERLQSAIRSGVAADAGPADASVSLHASHGLSRQVEVLREVLTGVFADDPTLEPRHVVIATPDPGGLAPHLAATFAAGGGRGVEPDAGGETGRRDAHPGTGLRIQVAEGAATDANRLYAVLVDLLRLPSSRATASGLLALATHPFVARRFGLDGEDADRLEELLERSGVRWGINPAHRARFGLAQVPQNTWQLGVQRLTLGEAFSGDRPTSVGVVATVDDVTSTDSVLIGALAELVSRVSRIVRACAEPGTMTEWAERLRTAVDLLTDVPFAEGWQLSQVWSALDALQARGGASGARLGAADALALLEGEFAWRVTRPTYGNGSLVVCSLEALAQVPHRVVCLVGLDERTFPRRALGDGDDLLARDPEPGDPDPGADDRQAFLDAVLAATQRVVIIHQGHSAHTNEDYPPPAGVLELVEAFGADAVRHEPLQAFAPANFTAPSRSFDVAALRGARALVGERTPAPDVWAVGHVHRSEELTALDLPALSALLKHPVRAFLRQRAGVTLGEDEPASEELPLDLDALEEWQIGNRMLDALRAGQPLEPLVTAEWLSGDVPPARLGGRAIEAISGVVARIHRDFERATQGATDAQVIDLVVDGVRLTGRVTTRGGRVADSLYSRVGPRHLVDAWVRSLALSAASGERVDAILIGRRGPERLVAPPPELARRLLGDLVALARQGSERVLPLPPTAAHRWAAARARGEDPLAEERLLDRDWRRDRDEAWDKVLPRGRKPWRMARQPDDPWGHAEENSAFGALAAIAWAPIVTASGS
ncbi:MAG: exodeoxyribonuclease V subunit gamma [Propionibacteriaceae bacterium]|nr:exodeoxyribonuclease V subunit gamma [Propionibacteriaceae bacterium]